MPIHCQRPSTAGVIVAGTSSAASWSTVPTGTIGWLNVIDRNGANPTAPAGWTRSTSSASGVAAGASTSSGAGNGISVRSPWRPGDRLRRPVERGGLGGAGVERREAIEDGGDGVRVERGPFEERDGGGGDVRGSPSRSWIPSKPRTGSSGSSGSGPLVVVTVVVGVGSGGDVLGVVSPPPVHAASTAKDSATVVAVRPRRVAITPVPLVLGRYDLGLGRRGSACGSQRGVRPARP